MNIKMINKKYGYLTIVSFAGWREANWARNKRISTWLCRCDCGKEIVAHINSLNKKNRTSCGCKSGHGGVNKKRLDIDGTGGKQNKYTRNSWRAMWSRCAQPERKDYPKYGGKGVTVCERWKVFANFLTDMGPRPQGTSIDRINADGNPYGHYEPGNCRWATTKQQSANQRQNGGRRRNPSQITLA
ncbi:MAG: hypothetical protein MN733_22835 [Nitrososphaera sp.]|nr:hypothetical protein [Nitrososphaera sp.]